MKRLDSRFHGNDGKRLFRTYYETIKKEEGQKMIQSTHSSSSLVHLFSALCSMLYALCGFCPLPPSPEGYDEDDEENKNKVHVSKKVEEPFMERPYELLC